MPSTDVQYWRLMIVMGVLVSAAQSGFCRLVTESIN